MYPRNSATPERVAIGQVVLIADGTIQTSAVVITVRGQGGAEATGGGTTVYGAEGTVYYTPTQAETNYTSFVVIASKASCFSASQTVITTASSTAGQVDVKSIAGTAQTANDNGADINTLIANQGDWATATGFATPTNITAASGVVLSGVTHTGAVIPNVTLTATCATNTDMRGTDSAATEAKQDIIDANVDAILVDTGTTLPNQITALNDVSTSDIATELATYDGPTNTEMEARTPSASELLYITRHAASAKPVTFSGTGTTTTGTMALVDGVTPSANDDNYNGAVLVFNSGTLDEVRTDITDYNGTTKEVTVTAVPFAIDSTHTAILV